MAKSKKPAKGGKLIQFPAAPTRTVEVDPFTQAFEGFAEANGVAFKVREVDENPNFGDGHYWKRASHWLVTLTLGKRKFETFFSKRQDEGVPVVPPSPGEVLSCLSLDGRTLTDTPNLETWADTFGYVLDEAEDNKRARVVFEQVKDQCAKLKKFLGAPLYDLLLKEGGR